jgi:HEAT repeat protein
MPFVKREVPARPAADQRPEDSLALHIAALRGADSDARWSAARALGGHAQAVPALAAALGAEENPRVREAIMTALMRIGDEASVRALLPYLRSQDAGQRAAAIETLQNLPEAILPFMASLLNDSDTDVRILATELARNMPAAEANHVLCTLLEHEQHPNVCAAAIDVLAEVGTRDAVPTLQACAERFAGTPFLPFAVSTAIARISDAEG